MSTNSYVRIIIIRTHCTRAAQIRTHVAFIGVAACAPECLRSIYRHLKLHTELYEQIWLASVRMCWLCAIRGGQPDYGKPIQVSRTSDIEHPIKLRCRIFGLLPICGISIFVAFLKWLRFVNGPTMYVAHNGIFGIEWFLSVCRMLWHVAMPVSVCVRVYCVCHSVGVYLPIYINFDCHF